MPWMGEPRQIEATLALVGADQDDQGRYQVSDAEGIVAGIGGQEFVVPDETVFYVEGQPRSLVKALEEHAEGFAGFVLITAAKEL